MKGRLELLFEERGRIRRVGVVGMGYVGIPSAVLFADAPVYESVLGFQRESPSGKQKIAMLNRGESPLKGEEPELAGILQRVVREGRFRCTSDFSEVGSCDAVTIAVQTPFRRPEDLVPDFSPLEEAVRRVGEHLVDGMLVVLESTVTPGTTTGIVRQLLEGASGMRAGEDFALAHAPERVMVGRLVRNLREHDRIVGGIDDASTRRACELYRPILTKGKLIPMGATAAEVEKTAENALRDLQIAAANQLAIYCEAMGVNFYDVHHGIASLREEGVTRALLLPGAGVGGHCLTKDTFHLERGARMLGGGAPLPQEIGSLFLVARRVNDFMPVHMAELTLAGLVRAGKKMDGARIALLGWAFIADSDDARNTPAEAFRNLVAGRGAEVSVHDPHVEEYEGVEILHDLDAALAGADAIAICTGHRLYRSLEPAHVRTLSGAPHPVIVDGRNVIDPDPFIHAGFVYKGIGRGDRNSHRIAEA
ncbi:MAG: nucleotide sugar dehydrogenase [Methanomicrobiales archaeon]|nr:nucleotide sugar dehydrogenase [Methanomicrobiales archaeon]